MNTIRKYLLVLCFILLGFSSLYAQTGLATAPNDSNKVYEDGYMGVQVQPKFPGDILKYFADSIRYPVEAREKNIQGTVTLIVIIERDGSISNIKVLRAADVSLINEAKRVVSTMPKWVPGKENGTPVRVQRAIPVKFKL
jgi:periplasmic protein TonB